MALIDTHALAGKNDTDNIKVADHLGQSITYAESYTISSVKVYMMRLNDPGDIICELFAADGSGNPTGAALASVTVDAITLMPDQLVEDWREFTFDVPYAIVADTQYALSFRTTIGGGTIYATLADNTADNSYAGGTGFYSVDSGANYANLPYDYFFETWGEVGGGGAAVNMLPINIAGAWAW